MKQLGRNPNPVRPSLMGCSCDRYHGNYFSIGS
jgi:hypothetical protein